MGNSVPTGGETPKENTDVLIEEYISKKKSLETTVVTFVKSVDSLRATAEYFAGQLKKQHVSSSEETYKAAIKVLLSSQVLNVDLRNSFMKKLAEFFESISKSIEKEGRISLPSEGQICTHLQSYIDLCTEEHNPDFDEYVSYETERKQQERIIINLHDEIEILKKQIENGIEGSTTRDSEIEIACNYQSEINKLESHSKLTEKKLNQQASEQEKMKNTITYLEAERDTKDKQITQLREEINNERECFKEKINRLEEDNNAYKAKLENEKTSTNCEITKLNTELKSFEGQMTKLTEEAKQKDTDIANLDNDKKALEIEKGKMYQDIQQRDKTIRELETEIENKNTDIAVLDSELKAQKEDLERLEKHKRQNDKKIRELETELANKNTDIDKLGNEKKSLHNERDQMCKEIESNSFKLTAQKKNIDDLRIEIRQKDMKIRKLESDIENKNAELRAKMEDLEGLGKDLRQKQTGIQELETEIRSKNGYIAELQKNLKDLQYKNDSLLIKEKRIRQESLEKYRTKEKENLELQQKYREVNSVMEKTCEELRLLKSKMFIKVNLFCHHRSNIITNIEHELMAILKSKIDENHVELIFDQHTDTPDSDTDPTIALCMTASRIGTDAENAVKELNMSSKTALLMIHHKDEHALPQQSSERVLTGPGFKKLGCISDMAFLSGKGFFSCEINNNSIVRLVSFIKKEGVKYRKYQS